MQAASRGRSCVAGPFASSTLAGVLSSLGFVEDALELAKTDDNNPPSSLFWKSQSAMRRGEGFLQLVKDQRIWDYWIAKRVRPDTCAAEQDFPYCRELEKALASAQPR